MSGTEDPAQDLAAEYVLGTLDAAEAAEAQARLRADAGFAAAVGFWEARLISLATLAPPAEPPAGLWARIELSIGAAPANDNVSSFWFNFWRATSVAGLAVAAGLAAFIALRPQPVPPAYAVLAPTGSTSPVLIAFAGPDGSIRVRSSAAITVASDRDLQLWALEAGATRPRSLGLLPAGGLQVPPGVVPGTQLLVSLEPKGGSPTGLPTGAVVYGGTLRLE